MSLESLEPCVRSLANQQRATQQPAWPLTKTIGERGGNVVGSKVLPSQLNHPPLVPRRGALHQCYEERSLDEFRTCQISIQSSTDCLYRASHTPRDSFSADNSELEGLQKTHDRKTRQRQSSWRKQSTSCVNPHLYQ